MTGHDRFAERTAELCRRAGFDLAAGYGSLARYGEDEAVREAGPAAECAFVHPHPGNPCQPREAGYRPAGPGRGGVIVR